MQPHDAGKANEAQNENVRLYRHDAAPLFGRRQFRASFLKDGY